MAADARDYSRVSSSRRDEDVWQWSRETGMRRPDLEMLEKSVRDVGLRKA